jgi:hypothetical protein
MKKQIQVFKVECKKLEKANTLSAVFSTADVDRHGDIVMQNWELKNYLANPVILNSHNSFDATEVIGKAINLSTNSGRLEGEIEFAVDANPKARVIYDLYAGGYLHAFSVGFMPLEMDSRGIITRSELLEISAVSVPANQMALAKSKGIDVGAIEGKKHVITQEEYDLDPTLAESGLEVGDEIIIPDEADEALYDTDTTVTPPVEETPVETPVVSVEAPQEATDTPETAVEDTQTKLLKVVKQLCDEHKGRNLTEQRKKEKKRAINKAIRALIQEKKCL